MLKAQGAGGVFEYRSRNQKNKCVKFEDCRNGKEQMNTLVNQLELLLKLKIKIGACGSMEQAPNC